MGVSAIDAADRTIMSTVFEDVKRAFDVSDGQLGTLVGAYSVVAAISVLPFGFLADRMSRVKLIALGMAPWGLAMILTGASTSFTMMFVVRLLLGTVEATNGPSTPSLIGDYYPVDRRSRLYGIYGIGSLAGTLFGFAVAGVLATLFSWRLTFVVWGLVGFAVGALVLKVMREPDRGVPDALHRLEHRIRALDEVTIFPTNDATSPVDEREVRVGDWDYREMPWRKAVREIVRIRTMWILFVAGSLGEFLMSGLATWAVTFFRRYHGLSAAGAGAVTALLAVGTVAGVYLGGRIGDRMLARGEPGKRLWLSGLAGVATTATIIPAFASTSLAVAVPLFLATGFLIGLPMAPRDAVGLDIIVPHLRGRASAVRSILRVGMTALAPVAFGVLSESFGLRQSILFGAPTLLVGGLVTLLAARTYPHDMEFAQAEALRQHLLEERGEDGATP